MCDRSGLQGDLQGAVGANGDAVRFRGRGRKGPGFDVAVRADPADAARGPFGEPAEPAGAGGDRVRARGPVRSGNGNSVIRPPVVMRPILSALISVNHSAPSGPGVIPNGPAPGVGIPKLMTEPSVAILPMRCPWDSVNHKASSGPAVTSEGAPKADQAGRTCVLRSDSSARSGRGAPG